jgi:hypothetical protein
MTTKKQEISSKYLVYLLLSKIRFEWRVVSESGRASDALRTNQIYSFPTQKQHVPETLSLTDFSDGT